MFSKESKFQNQYINDKKNMFEEHQHITNRPHLQEMLSILKMDKEYFKAEGNYLYSKKGHDLIKYLDLAGGYGSLMLGHNHPKLLRHMHKLIEDKTVHHHQLSFKPKAEALGLRINEILKSETNRDYNSIFLNTGSEAVEAAIKHSLLVFNKKRIGIEEEINKNLTIINESFFQSRTGAYLNYNSRKFYSTKDIREYLDMLNDSAFKRRKPVILASNKSFHGKTLGALSVTSNPHFRKPFLKQFSLDIKFLDLDRNSFDDVFEGQNDKVLIPRLSKKGDLMFSAKRINHIVATILEPVIGEGGVHVISGSFLKGIRKLTEQYDVPLIFDEIQSGCYRCGPFMASFRNKVYADYYLLGKSLGGGLTKISALMIDRSKYINEFDLLHSSTFAEDDMSCAISLKSLGLMSKNRNRVMNMGQYLMDSLQKLALEFPDVIEEVRGAGLMVGINFKSFYNSNSYGIQGISRSKYFGYVLTAFLLNIKQIRVSMTLSDSRTIRILPSMFITKAEINHFISALEDLCQILHYGDFYSLLSFLLPQKFQNLRSFGKFNSGTIPMDSKNDCVSEVGFVLHYIDIETIRNYLPSLDILPDEIVLRLIKQIGPFSEPVLIGRNKIRNENGEKICITFVGLSYTSDMVMKDMRTSLRNLRPYQILCNKALRLLKDYGIHKIGLGQYNSIIMQNGRAVTIPGIRVTTGNGFTVYSALKSVLDYIGCESRNTPIKLGIVGAGGNIATIISTMLSRQVDQIHLIGRPNGDKQKLQAHAGLLIHEIIQDLSAGQNDSCSLVYHELKTIYKSVQKNLKKPIELWQAYDKRLGSHKTIRISENLFSLSSCDIVVVATSDVQPFLKREHVKKGAFICDLSVPLNCSQDLLDDKDFQVTKGGVLFLPNNETLYPLGLGLSQGQVFACMAETMLMGFEKGQMPYSFGELNKHQVVDLGRRVLSQGFRTRKDAIELIN